MKTETELDTLKAIGKTLQEAYFLQTIDDDISFLEQGEDDIAFLSSLLPLSEEVMTTIRNDFSLLFPYKKEKRLSFDAIGHLGRNIFLIDFFDPSKPPLPLSPYPVFQYEEKLKEEMALEGIPDKAFPFLSSRFHALVEKLQFLDFLRCERGLKDKDVRFYLPQCLIIGPETTREERSFFSKASYIERKILSQFVEPLGIVEKGDEAEAKPVLVRL